MERIRTPIRNEAGEVAGHATLVLHEDGTGSWVWPSTADWPVGEYRPDECDIPIPLPDGYPVGPA